MIGILNYKFSRQVAEDRRLSQSYAVPKIMYDTGQIEGEEKVKTIIECVELVLKFSLECESVI